VAEQNENEQGHVSEAIDFSLVHADDLLLDALSSADPRTRLSAADDELAALLLSWRDDVDEEPIGEPVDTDVAVAAVLAGRRRRNHRPRLLAPVAAAAAVLAIAFTGVGFAAHGAEPGDPLWGLTTVLYAEHAKSVEAAAEVRGDLLAAESALLQGRLDDAKSKLENAKATLPRVATEDGKEVLAEQHAELEAKLPDSPSNPPAPAPSPNPTTAPQTSASPEPSLPPSSSPQAPSTSSTPSEPSSPPPSDPGPNSQPPSDPPLNSVEGEPNSGTGSAPNGSLTEGEHSATQSAAP